MTHFIDCKRLGFETDLTQLRAEVYLATLGISLFTHPLYQFAKKLPSSVSGEDLWAASFWKSGLSFRARHKYIPGADYLSYEFLFSFAEYRTFFLLLSFVRLRPTLAALDLPITD